MPRTMHAKMEQRSDPPRTLAGHPALELPFPQAPQASTVDQQPQQPPRLFTTLCVLTILGNLGLIVVNLLKVGLLDAAIRNGGVGADASVYLNILLGAVLISCAGAAFGAALMLLGRRLGYRIYAVSTLLHLAATVGVMLLWVMTVYFLFVAALLFLYCFIPVGFLLYFRRYRGWLR